MIIYALVARSSFVLAEYTPYDGDYPSLARKILARSARSQAKTTLSKDDYAFSFFSDNEFTFLCMNKVNVPKEVTYKFLDELSESFFSKHGRNEEQSWTAKFTLTIKQLIEKYEGKKPNDKLDVIEDDLKVVIDVAHDNIDKLLERGQALEVIQAKASSMRYSADIFRRNSKKLKRAALMEKYKNTFIIVAIVAGMGYLTYMIF